jgi:hypothetical protein
MGLRSTVTKAAAALALATTLGGAAYAATPSPKGNVLNWGIQGLRAEGTNRGPGCSETPSPAANWGEGIFMYTQDKGLNASAWTEADSSQPDAPWRSPMPLSVRVDKASCPVGDQKLGEDFLRFARVDNTSDPSLPHYSFFVNDTAHPHALSVNLSANPQYRNAGVRGVALDLNNNTNANPNVTDLADGRFRVQVFHTPTDSAQGVTLSPGDTSAYFRFNGGLPTFSMDIEDYCAKEGKAFVHMRNDSTVVTRARVRDLATGVAKQFPVNAGKTLDAVLSCPGVPQSPLPNYAIQSHHPTAEAVGFPLVQTDIPYKSPMAPLDTKFITYAVGIALNDHPVVGVEQFDPAYHCTTTTFAGTAACNGTMTWSDRSYVMWGNSATNDATGACGAGNGQERFAVAALVDLSKDQIPVLRVAQSPASQGAPQVAVGFGGYRNDTGQPDYARLWTVENTTFKPELTTAYKPDLIRMAEGTDPIAHGRVLFPIGYFSGAPGF